MSAATPAASVARMAEAASSFLEALSEPQCAKASFDFNDTAQRTDWAYFPRGHAGLPLHEMELRQQKFAHGLISSALSLHAYAQVTAITALESVLDLLEGRRLSAVRDSGRYFFSVFGAPGGERWGWRLEGHHVSLNFTIMGGRLVSPTPIFLGANPAEVRHGDYAAIRPCGEEEDAARELLAMLDSEQRAAAVIAVVAPPDFVLANLPAIPETAAAGDAVPPSLRRVREIQEAWDALPPDSAAAVRFERAQPRGLAASAMTAPQRAALASLVDVYVSRLPDDLADLERSKIDVDGVYFAWAESQNRREGHYYRLQGGTFLVEYDNTQDGANHVHAVWRDAAGDFGGDVLRAHVRGSHLTRPRS